MHNLRAAIKVPHLLIIFISRIRAAIAPRKCRHRRKSPEVGAMIINCLSKIRALRRPSGGPKYYDIQLL